jgi:hypothetical protein
VRTRLALGAVGVAAGVYGALMLLDDAFADLVSVAIWLAGGVLLHDFVLAPLTILAGRLTPRLPSPTRAPVVVAVVVLTAITLLAIPVLGRFGVSPGNPTLLDRNYWAGWSGIVVLLAIGVLLASIVRARRGHGVDSGR